MKLSKNIQSLLILAAVALGLFLFIAIRDTNVTSQTLPYFMGSFGLLAVVGRFADKFGLFEARKKRPWHKSLLLYTGFAVYSSVFEYFLDHPSEAEDFRQFVAVEVVSGVLMVASFFIVLFIYDRVKD